MKTYRTMPSAEELSWDVLQTCFRPTMRRDLDRDRGTMVPTVVAHGCEVLLNLVGVLPRVAAGAVYLQPGVAHGFARRPARIVAVVANVRTVEGRKVIDWCEGVVGEIEQDPSTEEQAP